jgi:hypothetical protein
MAYIGLWLAGGTKRGYGLSWMVFARNSEGETCSSNLLFLSLMMDQEMWRGWIADVDTLYAEHLSAFDLDYAPMLACFLNVHIADHIEWSISTKHEKFHCSILLASAGKYTDSQSYISVLSKANTEQKTWLIVGVVSKKAQSKNISIGCSAFWKMWEDVEKKRAVLG